MEKFKKFSLSMDQLKMVKGGTRFRCQCNGIGTWTGNYSRTEQITNAINTYCANGGSCQQL